MNFKPILISNFYLFDFKVIDIIKLSFAYNAGTCKCSYKYLLVFVTVLRLLLCIINVYKNAIGLLLLMVKMYFIYLYIRMIESSYAFVEKSSSRDY